MPVATPSESVVPQSVFEGLFVNVLRVPPDGPHADELRAVGFDLRRQVHEYSGRVWKDAVLLTCRRLHPELPREEAMRTLGRSFIEGFLRTLAGRALGVMLPMVGTETALKRLQRFLSMGAPLLRATPTEVGPRDWRVEISVPWALADFDAGLIEAGLQRTGSAVKVDVLERSDDRYLLSVRW